MGIKLSVLICTIVERRFLFAQLEKFLHRQINLNGLQGKVEILSECDNKQISVGAKRQKLLERAQGEFIVFLDDDDEPYDYYLKNIVSVIENNPDIDCIGMNVVMSTNGKNFQRCCHSLKYPEWKEKVDGWDYVRNTTHFNPIRREIALQVGFKDLRFGEDKLYSDAVTKLCKKEIYITEPLFHYKYSTKIPHQRKYGFKR